VAEREPVVVLESLHRRRVGDVLRRRRQVDVVRLVGQVALDVVDDELALAGVQLAPLREQELVQLGVGDVAAVVRLLRGEAAVEPVVDLVAERLGPIAIFSNLPRYVVEM
jgi:hypothetical protein